VRKINEKGVGRRRNERDEFLPPQAFIHYFMCILMPNLLNNIQLVVKVHPFYLSETIIFSKNASHHISGHVISSK